MCGRILRDVAAAGRALVLSALLVAALTAHLFGQGPGSSAHADESHAPAAGVVAAGHTDRAADGPSDGAHTGHDGLDRVDALDADAVTPALADSLAGSHGDQHDDGCGDARPGGSGSPAVAAPAGAAPVHLGSPARDVGFAISGCFSPRAPDGVRMLGVQRT